MTAARRLQSCRGGGCARHKSCECVFEDISINGSKVGPTKCYRAQNMADNFDKATRSRIMASIKGKNTKPELALRSKLHRKGFRFTLHGIRLPGKPDIVLPKYQAVIFVNGCFWHGHDCKRFKLPKTNQPWWRKKISRTQFRDEQTHKSLIESGLRYCIVWECAIRGSEKKFDNTVTKCSRWIRSNRKTFEIKGEEQ